MLTCLFVTEWLPILMLRGEDPGNEVLPTCNCKLEQLFHQSSISKTNFFFNWFIAFLQWLASLHVFCFDLLVTDQMVTAASFTAGRS